MNIARIFSVLLGLLIVMAAACSQEREEPGVVATVNGRPIHATQLKTSYDLLHLSWGGVLSASIDQVKHDYGEVLGELIVNELIAEELDKRNIEIPPEEVTRLEAEVRKDYPGTSFEDMLVEEYIDITAWREQIRINLMRDRFVKEVLRPMVKLEPEDIAAYYNAHIEDFQVPPTVRLMVFNAAGGETVKAAMTDYLAGMPLNELGAKHPQVSAYELRINEDQLANFGQELPKQALNKPGRVNKQGHLYQAVVLTERLPETVLPMTQVFSIIEDALLEDKLARVFKRWLNSRLKASTITVNPALNDFMVQEEDLYEPDESGNASSDSYAGPVNATPLYSDNATGPNNATGQTNAAGSNGTAPSANATPANAAGANSSGRP